MSIDAEVTLPDLGGDAFLAIRQLVLFVSGNPAPIFLTRRVEVVDCQTMGSDGEHLRRKVRRVGEASDAWANPHLALYGASYRKP